MGQKDDLLQRVAGFLQLYSTDRRPLGVGVSGGADSVVLLHLLCRIRDPATLHVLHINHMLRGAESDEDERFVAGLSDKLGTQFHVNRQAVAPGNIEAEARKIRQAYFRWARHHFALEAVLLGHTATDQAETVMFRILRGTGWRGLGAMAPASRTSLWRPLLSVSRDQIRHFAEVHNIRYRDDSSNRDLRFRRNLLRSETLPRLAGQFNPNLVKALVNLAEVSRAEESDWARQDRKLLNERASNGILPGSVELDLSGFGDLSKAQQRRLLRAAAQRLLGQLPGLGLEHVEALREIAVGPRGHNRIQLPNMDAIRSFDRLLLAVAGSWASTSDYEFYVEPGKTIRLPFQAGILSINPRPYACSNCVNVKDAEVFSEDFCWLDMTPAGGESSSLVIRNWRPGDRMRVSPHSRVVKLKNLFQQRRIKLWERRQWPVLVMRKADGDTLVWARSFGISAEFSIFGKAGERFLQGRWLSAASPGADSSSIDVRPTQTAGESEVEGVTSLR